MKNVFRMIGIPILFIVQIMFAIASVILLVYSAVGLFIDLPGDVYLFSTVQTGFVKFVTTIGCSVLFILLAYLCRRSIKKIKGK